MHISRWIFEQELSHRRHYDFPLGTGDKTFLDTGQKVDFFHGFFSTHTYVWSDNSDAEEVLMMEILEKWKYFVIFYEPICLDYSRA